MGFFFLGGGGWGLVGVVSVCLPACFVLLSVSGFFSFCFWLFCLVVFLLFGWLVCWLFGWLFVSLLVLFCFTG